MPPTLLHPFAGTAADDFIPIVSGNGAHVTDAHGRRYIDAVASLWYCNIGHGREEMANAIAEQVRTLAGFHTFDRFTNEPAEELAHVIADLAPMPDARVFLTSGGSESVDTAFKLARFAHAVSGDERRRIIVSRRPSYHGVTYGGLAATGLPANQAHFGQMLPEVMQVDKDDLGAMRRLFDERGPDIAAVVAEPVIGAGGVYPPVPGYVQALRDLCDEHGALLILDEVICGFGRLGAWWGAERYGVEPDLVTFAKAVTSGYLPLGGVVVGSRVRERIEAHNHVFRHGYTYSGHPTACVAALTSIAITQREGLIARASAIGQQLSAGLQPLMDHPRVRQVRGDGAIWGVHLAPGTAAPEVRNRMLDEGVIPRPIGEEILAFCPPLVIAAEDVEHCITTLHKVLEQMGTS